MNEYGPAQASIYNSTAKVVEDPYATKPDMIEAEGEGKKKDEMAEVTSWVMNRVQQWRDHRRNNYELLWDQYERAWRGLWAVEDKNRKSERSTMVTPAISEAVENIAAEVEEALWGRGDLFDIRAEHNDGQEMVAITEKNKTQLKEDLDRLEFRAGMGEALINGAVYGSGIGEIVVQEFKVRDIVVETDMAMQAMQGIPPEMQVRTTKFKLASLQSINPRNFLIDPIAKTIDSALGVAIEEYVGAHIVRAGQKSGEYRKVEVGTSQGDTELAADPQVENEYVHDKVKIVRYYGLVPKHLIYPAEETVNLFPETEEEALVEQLREASAQEAEQTVELMPEDEATSGQKSIDPVDSEMIEAIVVIANDAVCLKACASPFIMEDRPVVAFPWDVVPGRFWGRGVPEKGAVPAKALDAEMRARLDALAFTAAPMMAMDASKLPRGFQLTVKPGKSILTNGKPGDVLSPLHFGQLDASTFQNSQQLDQMVQRATGSLDVISLAQRSGGDARPGAVSMMLSGIVKRHKRTLMNFVERFYVPALRKIMWRNMQFAPERYVPVNWTFNAASTMGILQREYEMQGLTSLMQTMDPQSKEYKLLLMGVVANTGLTRRNEIMKMIEESIGNAAAMEKAQTQQQVDPLQQQLMQTQMRLAIAEGEAKIAELQSRANLQNAKARNEMLEPQFKQVELATKGIYSVQAEQQNAVFDRRLQLVDRAIQLEDIRSNERIADKQMKGSVIGEAVKSKAGAASERVKALAERDTRLAEAAIAAKADMGARIHEARADERARARDSVSKVAQARVQAKAKAQQKAQQPKPQAYGRQAKVTE